VGTQAGVGNNESDRLLIEDYACRKAHSTVVNNRITGASRNGYAKSTRGCHKGRACAVMLGGADRKVYQVACSKMLEAL